MSGFVGVLVSTHSSLNTESDRSYGSLIFEGNDGKGIRGRLDAAFRTQAAFNVQFDPSMQLAVCQFYFAGKVDAAETEPALETLSLNVRNRTDRRNRRYHALLAGRWTFD